MHLANLDIMFLNGSKLANLYIYILSQKKYIYIYIKKCYDDRQQFVKTNKK
jgi:hypothetical protein